MLKILRPDLSLCRRARNEMFPADVVEAAAAAQRTGDWRAAAALARTDVDVDLDEVRRRFGGRAAAALEDDLRHLRLDLLWWHLPRHRGGFTTLHPKVSTVLGPDTGADTAPLLRVRLPDSPIGPQRLHLSVSTFEDLEYERWYMAPRYTWDPRRTGDLRSAWGGSDRRMPLLTTDARPVGDAFGVGDDRAAATERVYRGLVDGDTVGAWADAGITGDFGEQPESLNGSGIATCPVGLAHAAREAARAYGVTEVATLYNAHVRIEVDTMTAIPADPGDWWETPVRVPALPVPGDLVLIAAGRMRPDELHPLVRAALFPGLADRGAATPKRATAVGDPVRIRCVDGSWHTVAVAGGALRLHDHDDRELDRERVLRSLGGTSAGCFGARDGWLTGATRLPRGLADQRREVRHRMRHGDTGWLLDGLARGVIDPHLRDADGWTLLHMVMWVDHERVLPLLLDAGIDVDTPDRIGRTPLYVAARHYGSPGLVRALLDAGADPEAETVHGSSPAYVARNRSNRTDVPFLCGD